MTNVLEEADQYKEKGGICKGVINQHLTISKNLRMSSKVTKIYHL